MSTTDRRELTDDLGILLRASNQGLQASIWTAIPAIVSKYTPSAMTVECNPTIQLQRNIEGVISWIDFPKLVDCPVLFPSGGGYTLTFPIKPGDEVLVIFASRCIDAWFASGKNGIQNELRMHDPSDGFAFPGPRSYPRVLPGLSGDSVQLRADNGTSYVEIDDAGDVVVVAEGNLTATAGLHATVNAAGIILNGNTVINGSLTVNGLISAQDVGLLDGLIASLALHVHLSRTDGTARTSIPIPGT